MALLLTAFKDLATAPHPHSRLACAVALPAVLTHATSRRWPRSCALSSVAHVSLAAPCFSSLIPQGSFMADVCFSGLLFGGTWLCDAESH